jgi:peptide/nickel transport system permease protein
MITFILKRLIIFIFLVWVISSVIFILINLIPGDPAIHILGEGARFSDIHRLRTTLELNESIFVRYINFQKSLLYIDFGESIFNRKKVITNIFIYFPNTIYLSISSILVAIVLSFLLGIIAAFHQGSLWDTLITLLSSFGLAIPNFFLGPLLIHILSIKLGWFPVSGSDGIKYLILPSITLGLSMTAFLTRIIKIAIVTEINKPYILLARAKGLSKSRIFFIHVLKNCLNPIITTIGLQFGALLTGTIITEVIFSWQGIGCLLINSINRRDFPMIQGLVIFITIIYLLLNLIIDLIYFFLNPKLRYEIIHK